MTTFKPFAVLFALLCTLHLPSAIAAKSLVVYVYPHDELAHISDQELNKSYFQHWIDEMHLIGEHSVEVIFRRNVPDITNIEYSSMTSHEILDVFTDRVRDLNDRFSFLRKHLLLTQEPFDKRVLGSTPGVAYLNRTTAIASLHTYAAAAHEIGHLFSATHEDSEIKFNGWFCETYNYPTRSRVRSNCYRYSDKNRENIANYIMYNKP